MACSLFSQSRVVEWPAISKPNSKPPMPAKRPATRTLLCSLHSDPNQETHQDAEGI